MNLAATDRVAGGVRPAGAAPAAAAVLGQAKKFFGWPPYPVQGETEQVLRMTYPSRNKILEKSRKKIKYIPKNFSGFPPFSILAVC
jgi:hypothetical protein